MLFISEAALVQKVQKLKAKGGLAAATVKKHLSVETEDTNRLVNYVVGANIYKEGEDPKLKDDSEYPEWLWNLRTDRRPVPLEELDPDTWEYWNRLAKLDRRRKNRFIAVRHRFKEYGKPKVKLD